MKNWAGVTIRRSLVLLGIILIWFLLGNPTPEAQSTEIAGNDELETLRNPQALQSALSNLSASELWAAFQNPPADYRSMPLWVWNDELEWPRLQEQLRQFKEQGIGGVFVHPRPGLMTEYLGEKWFSLWQKAASEGKRLGLTVNIYDENSYPSGFAGGHVPSRAPDTASQYLAYSDFSRQDRIPSNSAETVAVFALTKNSEGVPVRARRIKSPASYEPDDSPVQFILRRSGGNPWTAGFPYVDLTNPETAKLFIETTFEAYKFSLGHEFGNTIRWAFDDEPLLATGGAYDSTQDALPLSRYILAEFQRRTGYDLADHLPSLYWDLGNFEQVRFDYWQILHDLWKENYLRPLFLWCDRNKIQFTGHWMEHEWPYPWISPADASLYAYEHVPGIDMLEGTNLRQQGSDPHMLFTIKQVASVANQLGRRAFCEAYGVAGWDSTFEHYKRFGDWLMVHGINFMNQHLSFATVRGARKRDHPQSFSDVAPWWPYYRYHADHLARTCLMLSQGESRHRLLLLEPTTSGFLWARRASPTPELEKMRSDFSSLVQRMADRQLDFDLGDEYILEWFGQVKGQKMQVGKANYELLIWPENLRNLRKQSVPLLEQFLAQGGTILALSDPASRIDGKESSQLLSWPEKYPKQWIRLSSREVLFGEIHRRLPPRVFFEKPVQFVGLAERFLKNGDRIFCFANSGKEHIREVVTVAGAGRLEQWNTENGNVQPVAVTGQNGQIQFPLELPPAGCALYLWSELGKAAQMGLAESPNKGRIEVVNWETKPESPNVLVLDYCTLLLNGKTYQDINTWSANWLIWQAHGFERPAWDNAVQFKQRVFDRNFFPSESGFEAKFVFEIVDPTRLNNMALAVECPERYEIFLNDKQVHFENGTRWLDPHLIRADVQDLLLKGHNEIRILGHPFDVRMELENLYLLGDFQLFPKAKGFSIQEKSGEWGFKSGTKQGYPFYSGIVRYETEVRLQGNERHLSIKLGEWQGSLVEVLIDGKSTKILAWPPYQTMIEIGTAGTHLVELKVVSTPRNLFGPFHHPSKLRMRAWPAAWSEFPEHQPAGNEYDLIDFGLLQKPEVTVF